jgi:hypothetical protein
VVAHIHVEATEPEVAAVELRHLGAVALEDARELDCDVTATLSEVHHVSKGNFK